MKSHNQQTPIKNNGLQLVYVRRKPESEQNKNISNKVKDLPIKLCEEDEKNHEQSQKGVVEVESSSEGVSSAIPSVTIDSVKSNITSLDYPKRFNVQNWEERFILLQNFLKVVDQSTQDDYRQMLRSLSSVDLSRLALELEKRTIQLSSEEAKEIQRAKLLDFQGIPQSKK